jgi:hypothetical protein
MNKASRKQPRNTRKHKHKRAAAVKPAARLPSPGVYGAKKKPAVIFRQALNHYFSSGFIVSSIVMIQ